MKRRSTTNKPHDPHSLFLDEDISGKKFASLLEEARIVVLQYERLLRRNSKIEDARVIEASSKQGHVLVTADRRMESTWIEDIIAHRAKVILLTDDDGGPIHWAAALIAGENAWRRALLDNLFVPVVIRLSRTGAITKLIGERELREPRLFAYCKDFSLEEIRSGIMNLHPLLTSTRAHQVLTRDANDTCSRAPSRQFVRLAGDTVSRAAPNRLKSKCRAIGSAPA